MLAKNVRIPHLRKRGWFEYEVGQELYHVTEYRAKIQNRLQDINANVTETKTEETKTDTEKNLERKLEIPADI